ncbi:MAG: preprotein translocase subunit YajC [Bacteroidota bacterium]
MTDFMYGFLAMAPPADGGGGSMMPTLIMFGLVIAIMYFMLIRPQQKRQKEHQNMIQSIKKGDKIITNAGMHGLVTNVGDKTLTVQIADNVQVKFEKAAIANKITTD